MLNSSRLLSVVLFCLPVLLAADGPAAHWKLAGDAKNSIPGCGDGENLGVKLEAQRARFGGTGEFIRVPATPALRLGQQDFTLSVWIDETDGTDDDPGDLLSQFDSATRTGFHLSLRNNTGVTHSQANYRQLQFGIDAGTTPQFTDEGRPGNAVYGQSMAVFNDQLYVGTCEPGKDQAGHVYRYDGPQRWTDCGTPDKANSITSMAVFQGQLYVGSGKYRLGGSALNESENPHFGGRIFKYLGDQKWEEIGHFPEMECMGGMVVFQGHLYAGSLYKPAAFFRYEGGKQWTPQPVPNGKRVEALGVHNGALWATGYDEGHVYRFDGKDWTDLGNVGEADNTQTYAFATYRNQLHVATWRTGKVFAWDQNAWQDRGRLGEELEVMGMLVHNGSFYAGTLPMAQLYRYDRDQTWTLLKQLDTTPDVKYRRVWTMAQYRGKLFATTLPSGHVWSMQTGACVTWDREFPTGRHHIAAQRQGETLRLFVDGKQVAESRSPTTPTLNLSSNQPWLIGAGTSDSFHGTLADIQVFRRAISPEEIHRLADPK